MSKWKNINIPFGPIYAWAPGMKEGDSFSKRDLNKPGTLIELKNGKQYLIGDINVMRGVCDDCVAFESSTIVKRYKVLTDVEIKKSRKAAS